MENVKYFISADTYGENMFYVETYHEAVTKAQKWIEYKIAKKVYVYENEQLVKIIRHYTPRT